jgi:hypothetical protein
MQPNQNQSQPQGQKPLSAPPQAAASQTDTVRCKILHGKFIKGRGNDEDSEDQFAYAGEIIEVSRKFYDKLALARKFDTYEDDHGGTMLMPRSVCDMPLELVDKAG